MTKDERNAEDHLTGDSAQGSDVVSSDVLSADETLLAYPDVAELLGVPVTKVADMVRDHQLLAVRRDGVRMVPAAFFSADGELSKFVPGLISLLSDGGYSEAEILEHLFTEDDTLPGRPIDAVHGHLAREVMRRAQAMAF